VLFCSRSPIPFAWNGDTFFDVYKYLGIYGYIKKFLDIFNNPSESTPENIEKLEQLKVLE
jgi:3-deoxy-manno-octulosonate cytidylyltransferase (CMP-KDO synthetase)